MTSSIETELQEPSGSIANRAFENAEEKYSTTLSRRDYARIIVPKDIEDIVTTAVSIQEAYQINTGPRGIR